MADLPRHPYDQVYPIDFKLIEKWDQLDFVKALPDDIKTKLRKLPAEAEAEYDYCVFSGQMMPRVNPERSREYWLRYYHKEYQPFRERAAKLSVIQQHTAFCVSVERSLAHISEILEGMNRTMHQMRDDFEQVYGAT
jgi:hypothetical protein